ncbi:MAG: hypothetical protein JWP89_969 [Schlesneria sp.]|nr:hypothetical protein [Schlesneria sp.]
MKQFFYGWRRKAGVATLVMALSMAALWMRSLGGFDSVEIRWCGLEYTLLSGEGGISGHRSWDPFPIDAFPIQLYSHRNDPVIPLLDVSYYPDFEIPHWSLVLPLTMLSAYLILWKSWGWA